MGENLLLSFSEILEWKGVFCYFAKINQPSGFLYGQSNKVLDGMGAFILQEDLPVYYLGYSMACCKVSNKSLWSSESISDVNLLRKKTTLLQFIE